MKRHYFPSFLPSQTGTVAGLACPDRFQPGKLRAGRRRCLLVIGLVLAVALGNVSVVVPSLAQDFQPDELGSATAGPWTQFSGADGLPSNSITALLLTAAGTPWVGTTFGAAARQTNGAWTNFTTPEELDGAAVAAVAADPAAPNRYWFATSAGAAVLDAGADLVEHSDDQWANFTNADGLANAAASAVLVTASGEIWFGTGAYAPGTGDGGTGISVLDAKGTPFDKSDDRWLSYTTVTSGLTSNQVRDLVQDSQGTLWIATANGLNAFSNGRWTGYFQSDGLPANDVRALALADDLLWFTTSDGVGVLDSKGTPHDKTDDASAIFTQRTTSGGLGDNRTSALAVDDAGYVWIGTNYLGSSETGNGLYVLDPRETPLVLSDDRWAVFHSYWYYTNDTLLDEAVRAVAAGTDGSVWAGTPYGLSALDYGDSPFDGRDDHWTSYLSTQHLVGNTVFAAAEQPGGYLWFGTDYGVSRLAYQYTPHAKQDDRWQQPGTVTSTRAMAIDNQGRLWVGMADGLYIVKLMGADPGVESTWFYSTANGLAANRVNAIAVDAAGRGWLAVGDYFGGALQVLDPGQDLSKTSDDQWATFGGGNSGLPQGAYLSAVALAGDQVWLGTNRGAALLTPGPSPFDKSDDRWSVYRTDNSGLRDDLVRAVAVDAAGVAWFGLANSGLDAYTPAGAWQHFERTDGLAADAVTAVRASRQGTIWVGTDGAGVSVLDANGTPTDKTDDQWRTYAGPASLPSGYVRSLFEDSFGQIWVGTFGGGVSVYSNTEFRLNYLPAIQRPWFGQ